MPSWGDRKKAYSYADEKAAQLIETMHEEDLQYTRKPSAKLLTELVRGPDFEWTLSTTPSDCLGPNCEALHPIRVRWRCYIRYHCTKDTGKHIFLIAGHDESSVESVHRELATVQMNIVAARSVESSLQFYLLKPTKFEDLRTTIAQKEHAGTKVLTWGEKRLAEDEIDDFNTGFATSIFPEPDTEADPDSQICNFMDFSGRFAADAIDCWFRTAMEGAPFFRGDLTLKASIGTCAFTHSFKRSEISVSKFQEEITACNRQDGHLVSRFTFSDSGPQFLKHFEVYCRSTSQTGNPSKLDSKQHHPDSATISFTLEHQTIDSKQYLLTLRADNHAAKLTIPTWYDGDSNTFLDVNILDLEDPHHSYNLSISKHTRLDSDIPDIYKSFKPSINFDKVNDPKASTIFEYPQSHKQHIRKIEQRRSWNFQLPSSDYEVQVHLTQEAVMVEGMLKPKEAQWSVVVSHHVWQENLCQNAALGIGQMASWSAQEHEFFPLSGQRTGDLEGTLWTCGKGIQHFLLVMKRVERIMQGDIEP